MMKKKKRNEGGCYGVCGIGRKKYNIAKTLGGGGVNQQRTEWTQIESNQPFGSDCTFSRGLFTQTESFYGTLYLPREVEPIKVISVLPIQSKQKKLGPKIFTDKQHAFSH